MPEKKQARDQHARFLETARALGCDEDEAAFDEKLRGIASQTSSPKKSESRPGHTDKLPKVDP